jgi:hypothetical protein
MAEEQDEATKVAARQFMSDVVPPPSEEVTGEGGNAADMAAWRSTYAASGKDAAMMEKFWELYSTDTSVWTMVYDEADDNETLEDTIAISTDFMEKTESIKDHCFGIMHTLESLEIEGIWFFNGSDPEKLFGANKESSWYTWAQLGPDANDNVKKAVAAIMAPEDGKLNGKVIKDTTVF